MTKRTLESVVEDANKLIQEELEETRVKYMSHILKTERALISANQEEMSKISKAKRELLECVSAQEMIDTLRCYGVKTENALPY